MRLKQIASCSSLLAIVAAWSGAAQAACAPNPSQAGQAVSCTGAAGGGFTITSDQSPLTVAAGAALQNGGDALTVAIPALSSYDPRTASITIAGSVVSSGGNGVTFTAGPSDGSDYDFYGTTGSLTVSASGSISGVTGISIGPTPGYLSAFAPASLSIDNFGTIAGTGGVALATTSLVSPMKPVARSGPSRPHSTRSTIPGRSMAGR